ncbi:MAG: cytochrome c-type biogenesis CcmF C-terminal domain-containing protein, partial [Anaerolineae bacterium]|nr:cytochrome c-type biogenesis CcmF C-terminal domain-containing protein [Anaerolineae bacterium]
SAEALPQVISREGVLLLNNLLLTGLALAILLGTLFPVLTEALLGMPIALGRPFFEHLGRPLALVLLLLLGICPLLGWRRPGNLGLALPVPLAAGVLTGLG